MPTKNTENSLEKAIKDAYGEGYATGWADALQMAAGLLGRIAKQRKYADANRWTNARGEIDKWWERSETVNVERREDE